MRFGIFDHVERQPGIDVSTLYEERLRFVQLAEEAGFYGYHVAEHHHAALSLTPSQSVYLAAVARSTKALRMGPLVYVLPMYHPVRLIEEICMVDQLSGGRYQVGIGAGSGYGAEFIAWGGEPGEARERFEETVEILRKGLQGEHLTHEGKFFRFDHLKMELRPKQEPHPPFWYAGGAANAARYGANYVAGARTVPDLVDAIATYRQVLEETRRDPPPYVAPPADPLYGGTKRMFIAESEGEARERALTAYASFREHFEEARGLVTESVRTQLNQLPDPETALERGLILAGSPKTVRAYAEGYGEVGANYFVADFHWGDLTHEEATNSMRLFAQDVMPAFA